MFNVGSNHNLLALALTTSRNIIRIGTRPSPLAKVQARAVAEALRKLSTNEDELQIQIVEITTSGDQGKSRASTHNVPLAVKSVDFTGVLDQALLNNEIDAAVHSLKDVPPTNRWSEGLKIGCCLPREDPMDVLVSNERDDYSSIHNLPTDGARIGTSSIRRQAQILSMREDLELVNLRGNVEARLEALRSGKVDALILASAGLKRLIANTNKNIHHDKFVDLKWHKLLPQEILSGACQGIVGVAIRSSDKSTSDWLGKIDDEDASITAAAERSFLDKIDSFRPTTYNHKTASIKWTGRPPLAALMMKSENEGVDTSHYWTFVGLLARPDGSKLLRSSHNMPRNLSRKDAKNIGEACAKQLVEEAGVDFYQRKD